MKAFPPANHSRRNHETGKTDNIPFGHRNSDTCRYGRNPGTTNNRSAFLGNAAPEYLSAVGNAGFIIWTTMSFLFALGTGTAILVVQKLGEEKPEEAESILGSTFVFSSFFSVLLFSIWFFGNRTIFHLMGLEEPILTYAALYAKIYTVGLLFSGINTAAMAVYNGSGFTRPPHAGLDTPGWNQHFS